MKIERVAIAVVLFAIAGCGVIRQPVDVAQEWMITNRVSTGPDVHSYANAADAVVRHLSLDLSVDFDREVLSGRAILRFENLSESDRLIVDTRDLQIRRVSYPDGTDAKWYLTERDSELGQALVIRVTPRIDRVRIDYETTPEAAAVQWLTAEQTSSGKPFLFTQSQAILARTWVPIQDSPGVRITYDAKIKVPRGMMAVMSAENPTEINGTGIYEFSMPQPIPSYLLALAVGDLRFEPLGPRSGVYAEPQVVERAAWEFADTPEMIREAEALYGPYRWGRYDILVLPASFPFGGMENPRLTFATPTIIAGDRSLMSLVAHELAHSWSGNLVTNATWNDFWLNEGFTSYFTQRIMEEVYGRDYSEMLATLDLQGLRDEVANDLSEDDTHLFLDLAGRNPDDGMTAIAYDKGAFLLRLLEETVGRKAWDKYLRGYFERNAFTSMTTQRFIEDMERYLFNAYPSARVDSGLDTWIYGPGLPSNLPSPRSDRFAAVDRQRESFLSGSSASGLQTQEWSTHEWLHFLNNFPTLSDEQMRQLDQAFNFSNTGNSEIMFAWLRNVIRNDYDPAYPALEKFVSEQGRRKFILPLYKELAKTEKGMMIARRLYAKTRPMYHSITSGSVDEVVPLN